jgi:hypothetical protein
VAYRQSKIKDTHNGTETINVFNAVVLSKKSARKTVSHAVTNNIPIPPHPAPAVFGNDREYWLCKVFSAYRVPRTAVSFVIIESEKVLTVFACFFHSVLQSFKAPLEKLSFGVEEIDLFSFFYCMFSSTTNRFFLLLRMGDDVRRTMASAK